MFCIDFPQPTAQVATAEERRHVRRIGEHVYFQFDISKLELKAVDRPTSAQPNTPAERAVLPALAAAAAARTERDRDTLAGRLAPTIERVPDSLAELERRTASLGRNERVVIARTLGIVHAPALRNHAIRILAQLLRDADASVQNSAVDALVDQRGADVLELLRTRQAEAVPSTVAPNLHDAIEYLTTAD